MSSPRDQPSGTTRLGRWFGLVPREGGEALPGGPKFSRYGHKTARLDQDIDDLRRRVEALEARIGQLPQ